MQTWQSSFGVQRRGVSHSSAFIWVFNQMKKEIIPPSSFVRDLSVYIDDDLSMRTHPHSRDGHGPRVALPLFARSATFVDHCNLLSYARYKHLCVACLNSIRLNGNVTLSWFPTHLFRILQSGLNAVAMQVTERLATLGANQHIARWFSLASSSQSNARQIGDADIPLSPRHSSLLSVGLQFIVSLTFLTIDTYVLLAPTLWLFAVHN